MQKKADERRLILKAAGGDLKAFEQIFEIYSPRLTDICRKEGLSASQSAAVVKKTFEGLARKLSGISTAEDFIGEMKSLCAKYILEEKPSGEKASVRKPSGEAGAPRSGRKDPSEEAARTERRTLHKQKKEFDRKKIKWIVAAIAAVLILGMCVLLLPGRDRRAAYEIPYDDGLKEVYSAYITVLASSRPMILNVSSLNDSRQYLPTVCIYDLTGDDVPELIYVSNTLDYVRLLSIYTVKGGLIQEIYSEYCYDLCSIFVSGSDAYLLTQRNASAVETSFLKLDLSADGTLGTQRVLYSVGTSATLADGSSESLYAYYSGEQEVGKDDFIKEYKKLCSGMTLALMDINTPGGPYMDISGGYQDKFAPLQCAAMDCDSAVEKLSVLTGQGSTFLTVNELLANLPGHFVYTDAEGGWATELALFPDGSFTGTYHRYSSNGDRTIQQCLFRGVFSDITALDPYSYRTTLKHLEIIETTEHYDVNGYFVVPTDPTGIMNGTEYVIYRPGAFRGRISSQAFNWAAWKFNPRSALVLPCWAIVSSNTGEAFFDDENVVYTPAAEGQAPLPEAPEEYEDEGYEEDYDEYDEESEESEDY